ncbi:MAG: DNA polymerase III subunit delta' [Burkholderiales bacterium]
MGSRALLLTGARGIGKRVLAEQFAAWRLCESPVEGGPCDKCRACHLIAAGNHPDLIVLEPSREEPIPQGGEATTQKKAKVSQFITVDQVRALLERMELVSHGEKGRVVIADPADQLNAAAANALLKTLEDPPSLTTFLLITAQEERLPVTLRSRCRRVPVRCPSQNVSLAWLKTEGVDNAQALLRLAGGAPLKARAMGESGVWQRWDRLMRGLTTPEGVQDSEWDTTAQGLAELCHLLQMLCIDLNRMREGARAVYAPEEGSPLRQAAMQLRPETISDFWMELNKSKALIQHPLNGALVRDELLLSLGRLTAR